MFDYGWRQYMPDLGRWNGIDQLAESYFSTSPYAYVANNPVSQFDVDLKLPHESFPKDLVKGMLLTTLNSKTSPVESIKFLDEKVKVYNFEVEGNHNYYVSERGILVHNDCLDWLSKARSLDVIKNGCEVVADKVVKSLGQGAEYLQITPNYGRFLGNVRGEVSSWEWHVAAVKDGRVFDRLTGKAGMMLDDYIKLFEYHSDLTFDIVTKRTVK